MRPDLRRKTDPAGFGGGRPSSAGPYSDTGIRRVLCSRAGCGHAAETQWSACADGGVFRPLCGECDYELNRVALSWWGDPEWGVKLSRYRVVLEQQIGRCLDHDTVERVLAPTGRTTRR